MNLRVHEAADAEAAEVAKAACWYDKQRPGLGDDFKIAYDEALSRIKATPNQFARLETNATGRDVYRHFFHRFPYYIVYEILATELIVLAVQHGSRRPNYWKNRRAK